MGGVRIRQSDSDFNERGNNLAGGRKWAQYRSIAWNESVTWPVKMKLRYLTDTLRRAQSQTIHKARRLRCPIPAIHLFNIIIISIMSCLYVYNVSVLFFLLLFFFTRCIIVNKNTQVWCEYIWRTESLYCHCIVQKTKTFGNSITTHTRATILLMTYMFINIIQINLTMTSQRTNQLNDSWCRNFYWPPDGAVEHGVKSFEASTQFVVKASLLQKLRSAHP